MTSEQFKQFYQTLRKTGPSSGMTTEVLRDYFKEMMSAFPPPPDVTFTPVVFKHCKGVWVKPPTVKSSKVMLFFHGGGYTIGSWQSHQDLIGRIAKQAGISICALNYRLAPEHRFPAALNDVLHAYKSLLAKGFLPSQIILCGSSAGGGLALALLLKLKKIKMELPRAAVLICPWVDLTLSGKTLQSHDGLDLISRSRVAAAAQAYLGSHDPHDPYASPLYGNLSKLPPLLIQAGTIEILWSEIETFCQKAKQAGVDVTFEPYEGMFHTWQLFASQIPEGEQAIRSICKFITKQL